MIIKKKIFLFVEKKVKEKKIGKSVTTKTELFRNSIFDSLDYTELLSIVENSGYMLDIKKNDYRIPKNINEIYKILLKKKIRSKKIKSKIQKKNIDILIEKFEKKFQINKIQNLVIHSNFSNLIKLGISPHIFLKKLFNKFPKITIFVPAGYFRNISIFKNLKIHRNPTNEFGILTNELLKLKKKTIYRNKNPFDNLIGLNKKKKYFKNNNYTLAYGKKSPYRKLLEQKTAIILLDVTFFYLSMLHMCELDAKVPYRSIKKFNFNGKIFELYARKNKNLFLDYNKFTNHKNIRKIYKIINFNNSKIIYADYKSIYLEALKILINKPKFLLNK